MIGYPSKYKGSILPALDFPLFFCKIKFSSVDSISSFIDQACSVKIVDIDSAFGFNIFRLVEESDLELAKQAFGLLLMSNSVNFSFCTRVIHCCVM